MCANAGVQHVVNGGGTFYTLPIVVGVCKHV